MGAWGSSWGDATQGGIPARELIFRLDGVASISGNIQAHALTGALTEEKTGSISIQNISGNITEETL